MTFHLAVEFESSMSRAAVLRFLCAFGLFQKGQTSLIQTQHTVMAAVGNQTRLRCELTQHKEVLQVTWQKLLPEGKKTLATCNKYFGQRVNAAFTDKVEFTDAGLQNSSIVMKGVTEQDEGCYRCLFNTYPQGALTGTTCIQLYELHGPVLNVTESNSTEELLVSCSATARPAPTVTLLGHLGLFSENSSTEVHNPNGTVTATVSAVLPRVPEGSTRVGCAARVLCSPVTEVFRMIPEFKQSSAEGFYEYSRSNDKDVDFTWIVVLFVVLACGAVAVIMIVIWLKLKHQKSALQSDSEVIKTPMKPNNDVHEIKTPSVQEENELRLRNTPSVKKNAIHSLRDSSPTVRRQLMSSFTENE